MTTRRMLVAYCMQSTHVETAWNYLLALKKYSEFQIDFLHVTYDAAIDVDFDDYDVIFQDYHARLCREDYVAVQYQEKLRAFRGPKVMAVQDEYDSTNRLHAAIRDLGFDVVLTCVPQDSIDYVYPRAEFPGVTFATVLTGYVPDWYLKEFPAVRPPAERPIVVGYRGRNIGARYGRLGYEKFEIGRRMKEICDARGIPNDIAMDEESRIYGPAWFEFVGKCRAMLGSESGSNVFDFDDTIMATYKKMTEAKGGRTPSYEEFRPFVDKRDNEISMGQISPRIFECALMRTPMILFRGRYSDAVNPDEHYIPLEKDFSNVDAVLEKLNDFAALESLTERAHRHLIGSGRFHYSRFITKLDELILRNLAQKRGRGFRAGTRVGTAQSFALDELPMIGAVERSALEQRIARPRFNVTRLHRKIREAFGRQLARLRRGAIEREAMSNIHPLLINFATSNPLRQEVFYLRHTLKLGDDYARENDRIAELYKERLRIHEADLEELSETYRNERAHLEAISPQTGRLRPALPEAFAGAGALATGASAYAKFGSARLARRAELLAAFQAALDANDAPKALGIAREYRRQEVEDEKANSAHYKQMTETYANCRATLQSAIDEIRERTEGGGPAAGKRVTPAANG